MSNPKTAAVVLAAGMGTRMKSDLPKALHPIAGRPMIHHVLAAVEPLEPSERVVVVGPDMDVLSNAVAPCHAVVQRERLGTADAVKAARDSLAGFVDGTVYVLYGDTPFIATETLRKMATAREGGAAVVVLGFRPDDPAGYGRLVTDASGALQAIVEDHDASDAEKAITLCNSGVMAIDAANLFPLIDRVGKNNARGEFYLTDIVALARADGLDCAVVEADADQLMGVDSRADLARAEAIWQRARRRRAMDDGATLVDPDSVWFSYDTEIGHDVVIGPHVVFGPGVTVKDRVEILSYCHFDGATVEEDAIVGPFARLRPGAIVGKEAHIGNFVEVKNSILAQGVKANHLSYIGDSEIGEKTNVGAGTITCNYDGYNKHRTVIGKSVLIGSNTAIVAPLTIGDRSVIGAGSTLVRNVPEDALTIARGAQIDLPDRAVPLREKLAAEKAARKKEES